MTLPHNDPVAWSVRDLRRWRRFVPAHFRRMHRGFALQLLALRRQRERDTAGR